MIFYPSKKRLAKIKFSGGIFVTVFFVASCQINIASGGRFPMVSIVFLLLSIVGFSALYMIAKRCSSGILSVDDKGVEFILGFRSLFSPWGNVKKVEVSSHKSGLKSVEFIGIAFESLDSFPKNVRKILEISNDSCGYHLCFEDGVLEMSLGEVFEKIGEFRPKDQKGGDGKSEGL